MSKISWIDCVKINNITYSSDFNRKQIEEASIGKMIGKVKFNVYENVSNANYKLRNGDATFLEVGTEIFDIDSDVNAIAVKVDESYYIYQSEMSK